MGKIWKTKLEADVRKASDPVERVEEVRSDGLICLKRFAASVRSKFHALEWVKAQKATNLGGETPSDNQEGLGTGLLRSISSLFSANKFA